MSLRLEAEASNGVCLASFDEHPDVGAAAIESGVSNHYIIDTQALTRCDILGKRLADSTSGAYNLPAINHTLLRVVEGEEEFLATIVIGGLRFHEIHLGSGFAAKEFDNIHTIVDSQISHNL